MPKQRGKPEHNTRKELCRMRSADFGSVGEPPLS